MRQKVKHRGRYQLHHAPTILSALWPKEHPLPSCMKSETERSCRYTKACPYCGRDFKGQKSQVCCSKACANKWRAKKVMA